MPDEADAAMGRRCSATTLAGQRCASWALRGSDPPMCRVHAYPEAHPKIRHGYYRSTPYLRAAEQAYVAQLVAEGEPLAAEIVLLRLKIRAVLAYLAQPEVGLAQRRAAYGILLEAVRTVSRLLRAQQALRAEASGRVPGWMPALAREGLRESTGGGLGALLASILNCDLDDFRMDYDDGS